MFSWLRTCTPENASRKHLQGHLYWTRSRHWSNRQRELEGRVRGKRRLARFLPRTRPANSRAILLGKDICTIY